MQKLFAPASSKAEPFSGSVHSPPAPKCITDSSFTTAFGCPREFLNNRFVYVVISSRARGLSIGVNMNPDKRCNFDCPYCEVDRSSPSRERSLDADRMAAELQEVLTLAHSGQLRSLPCYRNLPDELLKPRHVALSGDGEPTLCPNFVEAIHAVIHVRALGKFPFFKMVLITNASGLNLSAVEEGLRSFTPRDEIWAKLDAGTQEYMDCVNKAECTIEQVVANILRLARQRPVIIQSLFPSLNGAEPHDSQIEAYVERLKELKAGGAQIPLIQVYSATRPTPNSECGHLSLGSLSRIARRVREATGLKAEVF